ncbi:ABC transporter ATP-binding protein [bacterium]|nr:ABC transporter ATP-binding protein [bacterium]
MQKSTNSSAVISLRGLSKHYGSVRAVDAIDLEVHKGEVFGFLGRNGAGKTTTIRMILGLVQPTSGTVQVLGEQMNPGKSTVLSDVGTQEFMQKPTVPGVQRTLARVGALVETATAYANLTVRENLDIVRRIREVDPATVSATMQLLGIERYADRRAGQLSLGNKQRLALAQAMLHEPELLVLDEPVNGLDPAGIVEIRNLLRQLADENGVTIFLSSHILSEIAQLADRIGVIHEGKIIEDLDRAHLHRQLHRRLEITVSDIERAKQLLLPMQGVAGIEEIDSSTLHIAAGSDLAGRVAKLLVEGGVTLSRLVEVEEDLEQHFLRLTGEETR